MLRLLRPALVVLAAVVGPVEGSRADEPAPLTRRERGDLAIRTRGILRQYCGECHGETPARSALSLLDHKQVVAKTAPIPFVNLLDPARSQVIEFVADGSMPPGGRPRPTAVELATLEAWVASRAPSYPKAFDDRATLGVLLDDWAAQKAEDQPHLRYLSLAHLVRDDGPIPDLKAAEAKLQRALLAASGKTTAPQPVDDSATLFRLDLRTLGWDARDLFDRVEKGVPRPDAYPIVPFDLLLLEDPHALVSPAKDLLAARLDPFLAATKQIRPTPFLRADWLGDALAPGTPLAADLKSLVDLAAAVAKSAERMPAGPPARPFAGAKPVAVATRAAAPVAAWYAGDIAPVPDPFGLKAEIVSANGNPPASKVEVGQPFRLRVSADREARFVLLNVLASGDVRVQPVGGGDLLKPAEPRLLGPAEGKPFEAGSLVGGGGEETEHFVLVAAAGGVSAPTVIRSRHDDSNTSRMAGRSPVWRFVFDGPADGFDPRHAARAVVPVKIVAKSP